MINITDIYNAVNILLKDKYPTIQRYGNDVVEGFTKPSFFVTILPKINSNESINYKAKAFSIIITYQQLKPDEIDNLKKADEIIEQFGYFLTVNNRKIRVVESDYEFIGEHANILQVSIEIEYFEANTRTETSAIAQTISVS